MSKLWENICDTNGWAHAQEVDPSTLAISSPTVIFLTGGLILDRNPKTVAKGIKRTEGILSSNPDLSAMPRMFSWSHRNLRTVFKMAAYAIRPQSAYSADSKKLARSVIMPLVSENGKPLPYAEVQKRLRNITFFGYSAGAIVAQEVFNASLAMMKETGFNKEDARMLLHEVVSISVGTASRPTREGDRFTTLNLTGTDDRIIRVKNNIVKPLWRIFSKHARPLKIRNLSDNSLLITAAARRKWRNWFTKHKKTGAGDVKLPRWKPFVTNHSFKTYVNNDDAHSYFSRIVFHALSNAVDRKDTLSPWQLLEPPASLAPKEKALYQSRISKARVE